MEALRGPLGALWRPNSDAPLSDPPRTPFWPPFGPFWLPFSSLPGPGIVKSKVSHVPGPPSDNSSGTIADILAHTLFKDVLNPFENEFAKTAISYFGIKAKQHFHIV